MIADLGARLDGTGIDDAPGVEAAKAIRDHGGECEFLLTDVIDPAAVDTLVDETVRRFGGLDVLVNAAGNLRPGGFVEMTPEDLDATVRVHVGGPAATMKAAHRYWRDHPGTQRRVVNIASEAGLHGDGPYAAYGVAKAGLIALTVGATDELTQVGATAHVMIPQAATRMTSSIPAELLDDARSDKWLPGGEYDPSNVAPMLLYLASTDADWLAGRVVGGWGHEAHLYSLPARVRSVYRDRPWDLRTLTRELPRAFGP
jgi:NAD(P)-dependent dehydrogenase (short-subunit alcohol dehydrogenase family)